MAAVINFELKFPPKILELTWLDGLSPVPLAFRIPVNMPTWHR